MSVRVTTPNYQALSFSEQDLDYCYNRLSAHLRKQVNLGVTAALGRQGWQNVRVGGERWLDEQRRLMREMLCAAEEAVQDAMLGVALGGELERIEAETWCDTYAQTHWKFYPGEDYYS